MYSGFQNITSLYGIAQCSESNVSGIAEFQVYIIMKL